MKILIFSLFGFSIVVLQSFEIASAATYQVGTGICQQSMDTNTATVYQSGVNPAECVLQFKNVGTVHWVVPYNVTVKYLVVGGGGSSSRGSCGNWYGPGGGGGGVESGTSLSLAGGVSETISVGTGGYYGYQSGCISAGDTGTASTFHGITAIGGMGASAASPNGGKSGNGNLGGTEPGTCSSPSFCASGGGGGAGGSTNSMDGGAGLVSTITDTSTTYGSGGAGRASATFGVTASGGGVASGATGTTSDGAPNTGGGGADPAGVTGYGNGGSGIVVIRFAYTTATSLSSISISGVVKKLSNITLSTTASTPGTVTFYAAGRPISRCIGIQTDVSLTATCSWKVLTTGPLAISASLNPSSSNLNSTSKTTSTTILKRTTAR